MKVKYLIPLMALVLFSCENKEEPIKVVAPIVKPNTEVIKAFKLQTNHQMVIAMHYNWGDKTGYNLINTPDSLDIIVLKNNFENMTDSKSMDLKAVQNEKLTKVIISCDLQNYSEDVEKQIKKEYKEAKKNQDKKWEQAARDKAEGKEVSEDNLKPSDISDVTAMYTKIKKNVTDKAIENLNKKLDNIKSAFSDLGKKYGFNGFSIKLPYDFTIVSEDKTKELLTYFTAIAGKNKDLILIVENPVLSLSQEISKANYLIASKPDDSMISTYEKQSSEWSDEAYFPSFNVKDTKLSEGFEDSKIFTASGLSKDKYLIKWQAPNKKGIAIYHSELMYYDVADIDGYILPYITLRELINTVNAQK